MDLAHRDDGLSAQEWLDRGKVKLLEGSPSAAIDLLTEALALDPDLYEARLDLGIAYTQLQDYAMAVAAFERCLALQPGSVEPLYRLGLAHREMGDTAAAKHRLLEALRVDPRHQPSRQSLEEIDPDSLPAAPPANLEDLLGFCPECGTSAARDAATPICPICGLDLTPLYRGWVLPQRTLVGAQELQCSGCRKPVTNLRGECPTCGLSFVTGLRRATSQAGLAPGNQPGFDGVPEGATLDWPPEALTPPWTRALAYVVDIAGVAIFWMFVSGLLGAVDWTLFWIPWILYETLFIGWRGQTLGKWLVGATVDGANGYDVTYGQAFLRSCAKWLPAIPQLWILGALLHPPTFAFLTLWPPAGVLLALFTRNKQTLHDLVAKTVVTQ